MDNVKSNFGFEHKLSNLLVNLNFLHAEAFPQGEVNDLLNNFFLHMIPDHDFRLALDNNDKHILVDTLYARYVIGRDKDLSFFQFNLTKLAGLQSQDKGSSNTAN